MIDRLHYISQPETNKTITGELQTTSAHLAAIEKVLLAGGKWIQLRVKHQTEDEVLPLAIEAAALCKKYAAQLIVNDYPLVALKAGAYGVHLGLDDMPIAEARAIVGPEMIIGGTANTLAHMQLRADEGADYIGLGPYRFTTTKQNLSPIVGLEGYLTLMEQAQKAGITIPVIAIGGIELADIPLLMQTGIHGVAVSGALTNQQDTTTILNEIYESLLNPSS
jgi:thiamine-phosphate pyrophosphorylase